MLGKVVVGSCKVEKLFDKNLLVARESAIATEILNLDLFFWVLRGLQDLNVIFLGFKIKMKSRRKFSLKVRVVCTSPSKEIAHLVRHWGFLQCPQPHPHGN